MISPNETIENYRAKVASAEKEYLQYWLDRFRADGVVFLSNGQTYPTWECLYSALKLVIYVDPSARCAVRIPYYRANPGAPPCAPSGWEYTNRREFYSETGYQRFLRDLRRDLL